MRVVTTVAQKGLDVSCQGMLEGLKKCLGDGVSLRLQVKTGSRAFRPTLVPCTRMERRNRKYALTCLLLPTSLLLSPLRSQLAKSALEQQGVLHERRFVVMTVTARALWALESFSYR